MPDRPRPTTLDELARALDEVGVRPTEIYLHPHVPYDGFGLGQRGDRWVVYYGERGREDVLSTHPTEAEGCAAYFDFLTGNPQVFFETVVPITPIAEADAALDAWLAERGATRADLSPEDWYFDDIPYAGLAQPLHRRHFVRITTRRRLDRRLDGPQEGSGR